MAFEVFDDVAFFWFFVTLLTIVLLPWTGSWLVHMGWRQYRAKYWKIPHDSTAGRSCNCDACDHKRELQRVATDGPKRLLSWSNIMFTLMWLIYVSLLIQVPYMTGQKMATFDPYEVLELEKGASMMEIKRAYRSQSLIWHPDKHQGDKNAEERFVLISKAHQVLTDPTSRENFEKYGNADGYQGTSVTIGLPSFLTDKRNELVILIFYFIAFFIVLPVAVGIWWSKASKFHDSGVRLDSFGIWESFVKPDMDIKYLLHLIGASAELEPLDRARDAAVWQKFITQVNNHSHTTKMVMFGATPRPYIISGSAYLHAHLFRMPIPPLLEQDSKFVLKNVMHLLDKFIDFNGARQRVDIALNAIKLQQLMSQALWMNDDPLLQLPHVDDDIVKRLNIKHIKSIQNLQRMPAENRMDVLKALMPESAIPEVEDAIRAIPVVDLQVSTRIIGAEFSDDLPPIEKERIRVFDTVEVKAQLHRTPFNLVEGTEEVKFNVKERRSLAREQQKQAEKTASSKLSESISSTDSQTSSLPSSSSDDSNKSSSSCCSRLFNSNQQDDPNTLDALPISQKKDADSQNMEELRQASTTHFPFPKVERWIIVLVAHVPLPGEGKKSKEFIKRWVDLKRVAFSESDLDVEAVFQLPIGVEMDYKFEVHAFCDSYVGIDPASEMLSFTALPALTDKERKQLRLQHYFSQHPERKSEWEAMQAKKASAKAAKESKSKTAAKEKQKPKQKKKARVRSESDSDDSDDDADDGDQDNQSESDAESDDESDDDDFILNELKRKQFTDDEDQEEQEEEVYWYYLWTSSPMEALIVLVMLAIIVILLVDIADKKGWWDPYVQPVLDRINVVLSPFLPKGTTVRRWFGHFYRLLSLGKRPDGLVAVNPR